MKIYLKKSLMIELHQFMKLILTMILLLVALLAPAQTQPQTNIIYGFVGDYGLAGQTNVSVTLTMISPLPRVVGNTFIRRDANVMNTGTSNYFAFTNKIWGKYTLLFSGEKQGSPFTIFVNTNTSGAVPAASLTVLGTNLPPNPLSNYYNMAQVDILLEAIESGDGGGTNVPLELATNVFNSATAIGTNWLRAYNSGGGALDGNLYHNSFVGSYTNISGNTADYFTNLDGLFAYKNFLCPNGVSNTPIGHYSGGPFGPIDAAYAIDPAYFSIATLPVVNTDGSNDMVAAWTAADALLNTNVGLIINTNFGTQIDSNRATFFNPSGAAGNIYVRSNYLYQGSTGGYCYWQRSNDVFGPVINVWSNALTLGGTNYWCYRTNDGTLPPFTTTNGVFFTITNGLAGYKNYPVGNWNRMNAGAGVPSGIPFPLTNSTAAKPYAQIASPFIITGPEQSNNVRRRLETWGSDTLGRPGGYPWRSYGEVNNGSTSPDPIEAGEGTHTNILGGQGVVPATPLLDQQTIRGQGIGITKLGRTPGPAASVWLQLGNSNTIRDMSIECVVGAINTTRSITNLVMQDCEIGGITNIDNIYFGGTGILTDVNITRVKFTSTWDTMNGVSTGTFTDCEWHVAGDTNNPNVNAGGSVRPLFLQGAGSTTDNLTLINPKVFASVPYTNSVPQGCFVLQNTNCALTIQNGYLWHQTNIAAVTQIGGFNSHVNGDYQDVAVDVSSNFVSSFFVTVSNGVFSTNMLDLLAAKAPTNAPNLFNAMFTGRTFINTAVFPTSSSTNLWSVTNASASLHFYYNGSSLAALNSAGNWNVSSLTINGSTLSDSSRNLTARSLTTSITNTLAFTTVGFFTNTLGVNGTAYFSAGSSVVVSNEFNNVVVSITTPTVIQLHPNWRVSGTTMSATIVAQ